MEDPDSDSPPAATPGSPEAAMEVSTSSAIPSRITGIGEGEIQRLIVDLKGLSSSIGKLTQGLELLCNPLVAVSEIEEPSITAKCWTKQVRKLCHDTGDYLYDVMQSGNEFKLLGSRALNASGRHQRYGVLPEAPSKSMVRRLPAPHGDLIDHVHKDMVDGIVELMGTDKELRVVAIVGSEGIGKTTLAKRLYQTVGGNGTFQCRAFLRASPKPDIRRLLTSMFMQIQRKKPSCRLNVYELIYSIATYLRNTRYFVIIDDLWTTGVWEIISRAFPDGDYGSRIIITTQMKDVALACCGHQSKYVFNLVPLSDVQSRKLFLGIVFRSESDCPADLVEVSDGIIRKCGCLPLVTMIIASMLPRALNLEQWTGIRDSLPSSWSSNPTSEWMKEVVKLMFSTLRPHLKTCLLYFSMYPEGYIVKKDDLIKQWVVEGVLDGIEGQATEEIAGDYFDELVRRGMIQAVDMDKNGKVLSCTLHHTIHDVIVNKSMEENFVIIADYFQSAIPLPDKVRRLSVQFGGARSAYIPDSIMVSEVRSLAFFGFLPCFLSASTVKYRHVRVLILHIWADEDKDAFDLSGIRELLRLRYLKISCNIAVKLPEEIQGQHYLETLEVHATAVAIPSDIGGLSRLSTLNIAVRELLSNDIIFLQILPALTALSVHVNTAPTETIVLDEGGFLNLKFFTFRCSALRLLIEESSMPKIEKLDLSFNAHEAHEDGTTPITIEHLPSLKEISVKIGGAVADASSALADAVTYHEKNPTPIVQLMKSREDQEHGTLEEQDEIMEEETHEYSGSQEKCLGECQNTEEDRDETQDDDTGKDENKDDDSRNPMLTGSSSRLAVPVGWGIATAGWILSPVFIRLVDKALSHMEPGESMDNFSKLVAHIIPRMKLSLEAMKSSEYKVFFEKLVRGLKSNFYELEELLDEVEYERLESQLASADDAGPANQGVTIKASGKLPAESVKTHMTEILKNIGQALEEARDSNKLDKLPGVTTSVQRSSTLQVKDRHKTTSREPRVQVIGRDEHLEEITQLLIGGVRTIVKGKNGDFTHLVYGVVRESVIGIYGIAGSGKTTLAQHVYRSEKKAHHFEVFMWIHVSRNFSVGEIFREMLQQVTDIEYRGDSFDDIRAELKKKLPEKKFLLVLDGIWCDTDFDKYKLYELFSMLTQKHTKGSKILVTSRNNNAISSIGQDMEHTSIEIKDLSETDFCNLLMHHALGGNKIEVRVNETLKGIGAQIAKRLNRSPLAAALVGGLLRKEMTDDHWRRVKDDPYLLKGISGIMWLCYRHLDEQAKRCFAYCSIFPRRHPFERDELVRLWVAEGFIEATDAGQMEEVGQDYFGELVSSSFMQLGEKDSNGGKEYFLVHDLLHDIAVTVGGNDFFRIEDGWRGEVPLDVRHLFVQTSCRFLMKDVVKLEKLRSLIILTGENSMTSSQEVFEDMLVNKRLRKLRVLLLQVMKPTIRSGRYSLHKYIGDLKHMRYLAFIVRRSWSIVLPDAFTKLYHLQVLDCGGGVDLLRSSAEDEIKLSNLRHLIGHGELKNIGWLTWLENLPFLKINQHLNSRLSQLGRLDKLRGKLQIAALEGVTSMEEALEAKLADKKGLRELVLEWGDPDYSLPRKEVQANVLEGLCPSERLEELQIIGYQGERYPDWMVGDKDRPWRVHRLVLKKCSPLGAIPRSSPFFANLHQLTFQDCKWDALPDHMEHLEKLTVLIIYGCQGIRSLGELPQSLKYLEIYECDPNFMKSCRTPRDRNREKIQHIKTKFIEYIRPQDSSEYPDEEGVYASLREKDMDDKPAKAAIFSPDASLGEKAKGVIFSPDASLREKDIDDNPAKGAILSPDASLRKKGRDDNTVEDVMDLESTSTHLSPKQQGKKKGIKLPRFPWRRGN